MIKLGGLIDLKPLQEEKAFTATSKETGNVSVFKTKAARDAAIKAGTHEKRKTDKDTAVDVPGGEDKPKVNIFKKDKEEPKSDKSEPKSQSMDDLLDKYYSSFSSGEMVSDLVKGDLSAEDLIKVARHHNINLTSDIVQQQLDGDGAKKYAYQNRVSDKEAISRLEKLRDVLKAQEAEPKKDEPKSSTPKLDKDGDGGMSSDTTRSVEDYLNKELGLDGSADLNSGGAIEYMVGDSRNAIIIGNDEIDGKQFSVSLSDIDTGESNDTYKSFDSQEDAIAYAKELGQKLKGGKEEPKSSTPKLDKDGDGGMSSDTTYAVEDYLNKELGLDGSADLNSGGAIEYNIPGSTDTLLIGDDEIDGKPFSVGLANEDGFDPGDTYKSFDNQKDAMAYAKELAQKLKDDKKDEPKQETTSTKLKDLLPEEETFTAVNKKSGQTSVFKSKASRDAAIKKGTHSKTKEKGDSKKGGKGGVNIFNKDKDSGVQKSLFPDIKPDEKPSDDAGKIKDPQGVAKVFPKGTGTNPAKVYNQLSKWMAGPDETGQHWEVDLSKLTPEEADEYEKLESDIWDSLWSLDSDNNSATPEDVKTAKARLKQIEKEGKYVELVYKGLEKKQNKPKGPEAKDYWNSDNKPAPKVGKFKVKPSEDAVKGLDLLSTTSIGGVPKLTPEDMGDKEYERNMLRMLFDSLEDANFHTHNRFIFADLEGKPEKRNKPNYSDAPDLGSPEYAKWSEENSIFTKDFNSQFNRKNERDDVLSKGAIDISKNSGWGGNEILAAYLQKLRKDGKDDLAARIQKSFEDAEKSMNEGRLTLGKLLPEPTINEGTRSQVGIIDRSGKIASAYVHYDGYPSNMKKGLKKHMKNEKDVLDLIKRGGASGIYVNQDINFYDKKQAPMKGNSKDIEKYIKSADMKGGAEYVYLYNMKDKKWYFADTYEDKDLKKLF